MSATSMDKIVGLLWPTKVGILPSGGLDSDDRLTTRALERLQHPPPVSGYLQPVERDKHWTLRNGTGSAMFAWDPLCSTETTALANPLVHPGAHRLCGCAPAEPIPLADFGVSQPRGDQVNCGPAVAATLLRLLMGFTNKGDPQFDQRVRGVVIAACLRSMYGTIMPLPPLSPSSDSLSAAMDEQHTWDLAVSNITDAVPRWEGVLAIGHLLLLDGGTSLAAGHNPSSFASFAQQKGCTRRACAQQYLQCAQHDLLLPSHLADSATRRIVVAYLADSQCFLAVLTARTVT